MISKIGIFFWWKSASQPIFCLLAIFGMNPATFGFEPLKRTVTQSMVAQVRQKVLALAVH